MIEIPWSDAAENGLAIAAGNDLHYVKKEVNRGDAKLFYFSPGTYAVMRYEAEYKEAVLVLGQGENTKKWLPVIEDWALFQGALTIRTHITRKGLGRMFGNAGYTQSEIIMQKVL